MDSLDDEADVFNSISNFPVSRSFPRARDLTAPAADFLREVLENKSVAFDLRSEGAKLCFEMGWVHSDFADEWGEDIACFLPTKLHEK